MGLFSKRDKGQHYETVAKDHLVGCGLTVIERNFTARCGEIDLIMKEGNTLVFIEVRYRESTHYGHAAETISASKVTKLLKTANYWLCKKGLSVEQTDLRFDVIAIHQKGRQIEWIKNAITQG
ncbi:YraN family protein [Vibrio amylolyticus]|uniref:YraN family protein n=1 Tax=Vibrio TaxID=662 RepID=UPI000C8529B5|nr:YraN family protein [Vibrio sp. 10N.261.55.A7]PMJ90096.1 YraN family protein [Vibrio sp. 10N.261.55.A7]